MTKRDRPFNWLTLQSHSPMYIVGWLGIKLLVGILSLPYIWLYGDSTVSESAAKNHFGWITYGKQIFLFDGFHELDGVWPTSNTALLGIAKKRNQVRFYFFGPPLAKALVKSTLCLAKLLTDAALVAPGMPHGVRVHVVLVKMVLVQWGQGRWLLLLSYRVSLRRHWFFRFWFGYEIGYSSSQTAVVWII